MSGPTRPIPIGHRSQRSSPLGSSSGSDDGNGMISQSCPVNGNGAAYFHQRPPRAPVIGSLPEPSFLLASGDHDEMPELMLPPPAQSDDALSSSSRRPASVIQVASSCPGDIGFLRQGFPPARGPWTPSPNASNDFDLSKSPALAMMSAMRQARRASIEDRRRSSDEDRPPHDYQSGRNPPYPVHGQRRIPQSPYHRAQASNSFVASSEYLYREDYERTSDLQPQDLPMEHLSISNTPMSSATPTADGMPPRRPERRGSYDGGIFHFEDSE